MAAFFFSSPVDVDIRLEEEDQRKQVELKLEKERRESCPVYFDGESVAGQVKLYATIFYMRDCALGDSAIALHFIGSAPIVLFEDTCVDVLLLDHFGP